MTAAYSSVISFHTNPYTCGVARFNQALAKSMQVPIESISQFVASQEKVSLLSLKFDEIPVDVSARLLEDINLESAVFDLFLHGINRSVIETKFIAKANRVIVASREYAELIREQRKDVIALFAPGAGMSGLRSTFDITLLTFGMAHKIRSEGYRKLGAILNPDSRTFQLEISTALHDGTSFSEDFFSVGSEIGEVFEGNVSFLGFLADDEVSRRMINADALVAEEELRDRPAAVELTDEVLGVREPYLVSARRVLDETHGGLAGYLAAAGVTDDDVARLRNRLLG